MYIPYIRNTQSGAYIDTGITPDNTTKVIVWARNFNPSGTTNPVLFGSRVGSQDNEFRVYLGYGSRSGSFGICYGDNAVVYLNDAWKYLSHYHKYELNSEGFFVDDVKRASVTTSTITNNNSIYLFGCNDNGSFVGDNKTPLDICACKIYKNDVLVRDFTPTNSPSVGLYDSVSNTIFTNAGSGGFTYGMFQPDAYTPLEYITTSGSSYFITPVIGSYNLPILTMFYPTGTTADWFEVLGGRDATNRCEIFTGNTSYSNGRLYGVIGTDSASAIYATNTAGALRNKKLVVRKYNNTFTAYYNNEISGNEVSYNISSSYSTNVEIGIGASWNKSTSAWGSNFVGRIYFVGFGGGYNFVPAKVNNVAGMYDTYNDVFYSSDSATDFTGGPEMLATQQVEWGDGSGNKLYFTYVIPLGNQIVSVSSDANTGPARTKTVRFSAGLLSQTLTINQEAESGGGGSLSDYVQDGLVAHFDGISKGSNTSRWTSLVGSSYATLTSHSTSKDDCIEMDGSGYLTVSNAVSTAYNSGTIEVCCENTSGSTASAAIYYGTTSRLAFIYAGSGYSFGITSTNNQWNITKVNKITASANSTRFMLNGTTVGTKASNNWSNANSTTIGGRAGTSGSRCYFTGKIYSIRIYSRQLSEAEMLKNQKVDNIRFGLGLTI